MDNYTHAELQTTDSQETQDGDYALWALEAVAGCRMYDFTPLQPDTVIMGTLADLDYFYPTTHNMETVQEAIDGSYHNTDPVVGAMILNYQGTEFLFLHLERGGYDQYVVLCGSETIKAQIL